MPVQDLASPSQYTVWYKRERLSNRLQAAVARLVFFFRSRVPIIRQQSPSRTKPVFEANQTLIIRVGTTEVDLLYFRCFAFLDEPPDQKRHRHEIVKPII